MLIDTASKIVSNVRLKKASTKTAVYQSSYNNKKQLMKLVCQTLARWKILEEIATSVELTKLRQFKNNLSLVAVVLNEYVFNHKLAGCFAHYKAVVTQRKAAIEAAVARIKIREKVTDLLALDTSLDSSGIPRYVRVNTIKSTLKEVKQQFTNSGYVPLHKVPQEEVRDCKKWVVEDEHLNCLLVFSPNTDLHDHPLCVNGTLILQDKASCLPAYILNPPPGSEVIDSCAAPGNKTTHLAAILQNQGTVTAFEKDRKRFEILQQRLTIAGATCVAAKHADFLQVDTVLYENVQYLLVDPSCSGSGIASRTDFGDAQEKDIKRLEKLSAFQVKILNKALSFPSAKEVVYSTCSVFSEENEQVVKAVLEVNSSFTLKRIMPSWHNRGLTLNGTFSLGQNCIRATTANRMTGFFVAFFIRLKES